MTGAKTPLGRITWLAAILAALPSLACAQTGELPKVEDDWVTADILSSQEPTGWRVSAPTREMAEHLAGRKAPHAVSTLLLRRAFPMVAAPRACKYSWDIRVFPKDFAYYDTFDNIARNFLVPRSQADLPQKKSIMRRHAGRPSMWATHSWPGDKRHPHEVHSYMAVDIGSRMLILSSFSQTPALNDVEACSEAYARQFERLSETIRPAAPIEESAAPMSEKGQ